MHFALALVLVAFGGAAAPQRHERAELIGPLLAIDPDGTLVASARVPAEGDYRFVIRSSPTERPARRSASIQSSAMERASPEHGLWVRWRVEIEHLARSGLELRIEDAHGITVWRREASSLPRASWSDALARSCLGSDDSFVRGALLIAQLPARPPADLWTRVLARSVDCTVVLGDVEAQASDDLGVAREQFVDLFRGADLIRPWGAAQLLHLPVLNGAQTSQALRGASRRAWAESLPLGDAPQGAAHRRLGQLDLFLVDRTGIVEDDALAATIERLSSSSATFKVIVREGRWFDSRERARDTPEWARFVRRLADVRVEGAVLIGSDPRSAFVVEHRTREQLGYDLVEVVCGPSSATDADADSSADPRRMPGSARPAAFVRVGLRDPRSIAIVLQPPAGGVPFMVERTSSWLRPR